MIHVPYRGTGDSLCCAVRVGRALGWPPDHDGLPSTPPTRLRPGMRLVATKLSSTVYVCAAAGASTVASSRPVSVAVYVAVVAVWRRCEDPTEGSCEQ